MIRFFIIIAALLALSFGASAMGGKSPGYCGPADYDGFSKWAARHGGVAVDRPAEYQTPQAIKDIEGQGIAFDWHFYLTPDGKTHAFIGNARAICYIGVAG